MLVYILKFLVLSGGGGVCVGGGGGWGGVGCNLRSIQKIRHFCLISVFTITESFAKKIFLVQMVPVASLIRSRCVAKTTDKDLSWRVLQKSLTIKNI